MDLMDEKDGGSFGSFFGHPNGSGPSRLMVERILKEFSLVVCHI
jgi:hypothetical protein